MSETTVVQCSMVVSPKEARISSELMARHERLVQWVVRRQWLGELSFDDALHEGRIGLWHALVGYDPGRGTAFSSYAVPAITRAVWDAVAAHREPTQPACCSHAPVEPIDPDEWTHASQVRSGTRALVDSMPPRLRLVIVAHYGLAGTEAQSFAAIGRTLHVSRQRAHQLHVEALLWLTHPAHSLPLRHLLGLDSRACYRQALDHHYQVARSRRRGGRCSR